MKNLLLFFLFVCLFICFFLSGFSFTNISKKIDELETEIKNKYEKIQLLENRVEILKEKEKKLMIWNNIPEETV